MIKWLLSASHEVSLRPKVLLGEESSVCSANEQFESINWFFPVRLLANQANIRGLPKQSTLRKDTVFYKIDLYRFEGS